MKPSVAILGFGASSLYCIMACNERGFKPDVLHCSDFRITPGAFYFHSLPESLKGKINQMEIAYSYLGDEEIYLEKQWGRAKGFSSSFGKYKGIQYGYNPTDVCNHISEFGEFDRVHMSSAMSDESVLYSCINYDIVLCTFPLRETIDMNKGLFIKRPVVIIPDPFSTNSIIYDGTWSNPWVRRSSLFGFVYDEYPDEKQLPTAQKINFVQDLNIRMKSKLPERLPDNLFFVGRFAQLDRTVLADDAYGRVMEILYEYA